MKIRIPAQTISVDPERWAIAYDLEPKNVREDVKAYFNGWIQGHINDLGLQGERE